MKGQFGFGDRGKGKDPYVTSDRSSHDTRHKPSREKVINCPHIRGMLCTTRPLSGPEGDALFTYGLLQPGESLYYVLAPYVTGLVVDAYVCGYRMFSSSFPMAVAGETGERVWGTLLFLEDAEDIFPRVDSIEAAYDRVMVEVQTPDNRIGAWMYVYGSKPYGEFVESGDFIAWRDNHGRQVL